MDETLKEKIDELYNTFKDKYEYCVVVQNIADELAIDIKTVKEYLDNK